MYITNSFSFKWFLTLWRNKEYLKAITVLLNRLPNITYPLKEQDKERGEPSYNALLKEATKKYGHYNDLRNWKNVVWRELFHFIGATFALIIPALSYAIAHYFTKNDFVAICFFMLLWVPHMLLNWKKELIDDPQLDGRFFAKNILDLLFWHLPGILFIV